MDIRTAHPADLPGFLALAAEVEHWFGPMVDDPGFHDAVLRHIATATALAATAPADPDAGQRLLGGLLFGPGGAVRRTHHVHWLVVSARARGTGVGRALLTEALTRHVRAPATVEVVTFGPDHPGAVTSGARVFYERLDFAPAEPTTPGPEGGSRQVFRLHVPA
ncbi:GNAT family N-acetyltransferase [Streptomyces sp. NPDC005805]|uniref:GNAT family N-acetyltransferase n=1 Tax=Streptomyces sp. NPDC005805 TaxID=3157068 RepID=UPI0033C3E9CF